MKIIRTKEAGKYTVNIIEEGYKSYKIQVTLNEKQIELSENAEDTIKEIEAEFKLTIIKYKNKDNHICTNVNSKLVPNEERGYSMKRVCNYCNKVMDKDAPISTFEGLVRSWVHGEQGNKTVVGKYKVIENGNKLVYEGSGRNEEQGIDVLALKLKDGRIIGNASKLNRCGSYSRGTEAPAQRVMFQLNMAMIPFSVFDEAKLNIQKARIIEQGKEEDFMLPKMVWNNSLNVMRPVNARFSANSPKKFATDDKRIILSQQPHKYNEAIKTKSGALKKKKGLTVYKKINGWSCKYIQRDLLEKRHFVGAMVLGVGKSYFLFDVDRGELPHYRFNPFLTQLPFKVNNIKEAYHSLKPKEILNAEKKGLKVLRQGEWFLIPCDLKKVPKIPELPKTLEKGLANKPTTEQYNLQGLKMYDNIGSTAEDTTQINFKDLKKSSDFKDIKKKYQNHVLSRARDMNREIIEYKKLQIRAEAFKEKFSYFDYGGELKAGNNRPNTVGKLLKYGGVTYVKGTVEHQGREHEPLELKNWHIAVPNTSIVSFQISGDID